ncbi:hypothetical protein SEVIR_4G209400v4 [Setaria viridis]|uniref:SAM domain-containing protein n=2 Tax=Setaria TaxID=4554 RepID=K3XZ92_SETIT|nr:uncharacterized protein LOC101754727 [Setaria italica]XP_034589126.1 uncharacterized protein LOC117851417 [Setaria viridis]RCV22186.1 hypothetical protein SETIT_4G200600v2 [Setaria italica]TKW22140.1 hypothetical protein SEVIR_4G209400v2 [Setaria viridis]
MDWYAWLSRTGLAPSLTHEYGRLFSRNELEPGDAAHFDHDLLKSMGIAVAKHRLEILKLAKKQAEAEGGGEGASSGAAARLARRATRCLARCVRRLAGEGGGGSGRRRRGASSVTVVPRICSGDDAVRVGAVQRKSATKKMVLMITDGAGGAGDGLAIARGCGAARLSASSQKASLMFHDCYHNDDEEEEGEGDDEEEDGGAGDDDIKWDSMFQDLKPT